MTSILSQLRQRRSLSLKRQWVAAACAVVCAVALPQILHVLGRVTGLGTALGIALLPMHLPILFVGLAAGPVAGAAAGLLSPVVSFLLSGMPLISNLPLMMLELCVYGLVAGLLSGSGLPTVLRLLIAQIAGRMAYLGGVLVAIFAAGRTDLGVLSALASFRTGLFGVLLQLVLLPLIIRCLEQSAPKE